MNQHEARIMLVNNERFNATMIQYGLESRGFDTSVVEDGQPISKMIADYEPHLVLLGVCRPGLSGFEVLRRIRDVSHVPIILVSASAGGLEMVEGLTLGADDFVTAPLKMNVLAARIRAVLRRAGYPNAELVRSAA